MNFLGHSIKVIVSDGILAALGKSSRLIPVKARAAERGRREQACVIERDAECAVLRRRARDQALERRDGIRHEGSLAARFAHELIELIRPINLILLIANVNIRPAAPDKISGLEKGSCSAKPGEFRMSAFRVVTVYRKHWAELSRPVYYAS
jgi:hypothetical protein